MRVAALVVGAGQGERLRAGLGPAADPMGKAFALLAGRPLLAHALEAVAACGAVDLVVPVVAADALQRAATLCAGLAGAGKLADPVAGGVERQDSVARGLEALPDDVAWVAVHDAARALVRPEDVTRVVEAARRHGAALLAVPVADTLKRVEGGVVVATPDRALHFAAQTPQVFRREVLAEALAKARADGIQGTDDAALVERLGVPVHVVEGDPGNFKITRAADLARAELALGAETRR